MSTCDCPQVTVVVRGWSWVWHVEVDQRSGHLVGTCPVLKQVASGESEEALRTDAASCLTDLFDYLDETYPGGSVMWLTDQSVVPDPAVQQPTA